MAGSKRFTKTERAELRDLAGKAWEAELNQELKKLFEEFAKWSGNGLSAFDLAERIHEFHNGAASELYKKYTLRDQHFGVADAIANGVLDEASVSSALYDKLAALINDFRRADED